MSRYYTADRDPWERGDSQQRGSFLGGSLLGESYEKHRTSTATSNAIVDAPTLDVRVAITITSARGLPGAAHSAPGGPEAAMFSEDTPAWLCSATFQACGDVGAFRTHGDAGSEPRWEEFRSMPISIAPESRLVLDVFRVDLLTGKATGPSLGSGFVALPDAASAKDMFDSWVPLHGPGGREVGEVHTVMMFTPAPARKPSPGALLHAADGLAQERPAHSARAPGSWSAASSSSSAFLGGREDKEFGYGCAPLPRSLAPGPWRTRRARARPDSAAPRLSLSSVNLFDLFLSGPRARESGSGPSRCRPRPVAHTERSRPRASRLAATGAARRPGGVRRRRCGRAPAGRPTRRGRSGAKASARNRRRAAGRRRAAY